MRCLVCEWCARVEIVFMCDISLQTSFQLNLATTLVEPLCLRSGSQWCARKLLLVFCCCCCWASQKKGETRRVTSSCSSYMASFLVLGGLCVTPATDVSFHEMVSRSLVPLLSVAVSLLLHHGRKSWEPGKEQIEKRRDGDEQDVCMYVYGMCAEKRQFYIHRFEQWLCTMYNSAIVDIWQLPYRK